MVIVTKGRRIDSGPFWNIISSILLQFVHAWEMRGGDGMGWHKPNQDVVTGGEHAHKRAWGVMMEPTALQLLLENILY